MKAADRFDRLDKVMLTGKKVASSADDMVSLEADGALISVNKADIRASEDKSDGTLMLHVAGNARILFETLLSPHEAGGILSRDAFIEIRAEPTECSRCSTECSRCSTECSRCAGDIMIASPGAGVFRRRLT